ncbi:MAG TPA: tetratricopeptide repeat protein, partial [Bryobacteraceae bacterium]|nr:tetratricopeptide repeat protein [Bryobacteraceae bacterium]
MTQAPDVRSIFADGMAHHQAGRLMEAIARYRQALSLKPDLAAAHNNLAIALYDLGRLEEAEVSYRQALALQPNRAEAHNNLGTLLYDRDRLEEAVACYRAALALEPDYPEALSNLGTALYRQGKLDAAEADIRHALALKPDFASAHDILATVLWEQGRPKDAEASVRRALALAPDFTRALGNLGAMLTDLGRLDEAAAVYRQLLQTAPQDCDALSGLAGALAARGDAQTALETILKALRIGETQKARRIFADIVKSLRWTQDNREVRMVLARALNEAWARPAELARSAASLVKQGAETGPAVARAARAWPLPLPRSELFGPSGPRVLADDELLSALLVSAQNTDIELERFLTMARRALLEAAGGEEAGDTGLEFYATLARQCFINEYVFFHGEEEIRRARDLYDALMASPNAGAPLSSLKLLAVAAYFPLYSLPGAARLWEMSWPGPVTAVLTQQLCEPREEAQLRAAIPRLTPIEDAVSRLVRSQYEENPYPRWIRIPRNEKANTITGYLRGKFPFAAFQSKSGGEIAELLS